MEFQAVHSDGLQSIQSYRPGGFTVAGIDMRGSVFVLPDKTAPWNVGTIGDLSLDHLNAIAQAEPDLEVLLVGCGPKMLLLPGAVRRGFVGLPFSVDVMETGAACRTFNILVAENRKVGAALTPI